MKDQRLTIDEREMLRALWEHRLDCWHADTVASIDARQVVIDGLRDRRKLDGTLWSQNHRDDYTPDEYIDLRRASAQSVVQTPIRPNWARRRLVSRSIKSRGRFLTWWLAAWNERQIRNSPARIVARDACMAVIDAGLADIEPAGKGRFIVTPRDASPDWEYNLSASPHVPGTKEPKAPTVDEMSSVVDRLISDAFGHYTFPVIDEGEVIGYKVRAIPIDRPRPNGTLIAPPSLVPMSVVTASAQDPTRKHRQTATLARATYLTFAEHGIAMPAADVVNNTTRKIHSRPDRVAFRGLPRTALRPGRTGAETSPVRYQKGRKKVEGQWIATVDADADGKVRLTTRLVRSQWCHCTLSRTRCKCDRKGWRGHVSVIFPRPKYQVKQAAKEKAKSEATQAARPTPTSTRGPKVTAWNMTTSNLGRACFADEDASDERKTLQAAWQAIDCALRMANAGDAIQFRTGELVTILSSAQVFSHDHERAYPVREYARRAALDGAAL